MLNPPRGGDLDISEQSGGCGTLLINYADYARYSKAFALPTSASNPICADRPPGGHEDTATPDDSEPPAETASPGDTADTADPADTDNGCEGECGDPEVGCGCSATTAPPWLFLALLAVLGAARKRA